MGRLSIDTTFLIDLQRERRKGEQGPAYQLLDSRRGDTIAASSVVWGEFLEGFESMEDGRIGALEESLSILVQTVTTARIYAGLARRLRAQGLMIGANDLWIGSASIEHSLPLATRNVDHFGRLPSLRLIEYCSPYIWKPS